MQEPDRDDVINTFNKLFGRGWRVLYAEAIGIRKQTLTEMKPGPTLAHAAALAEFFKKTPLRYWPERFNRLRDQHRAKTKRETEEEPTA